MLKHKNGKSNKVAVALSRRRILLIGMRVEVIGFEELEHMYDDGIYFTEGWKVCKESVETDRSKWLDNFIQDDMLFKKN